MLLSSFRALPSCLERSRRLSRAPEWLLNASEWLLIAPEALLEAGVTVRAVGAGSGHSLALGVDAGHGLAVFGWGTGGGGDECLGLQLEGDALLPRRYPDERWCAEEGV